MFARGVTLHFRLIFSAYTVLVRPSLFAVFIYRFSHLAKICICFSFSLKLEMHLFFIFYLFMIKGSDFAVLCLLRSINKKKVGTSDDSVERNFDL